MAAAYKYINNVKSSRRPVQGLGELSTRQSVLLPRSSLPKNVEADVEVYVDIPKQLEHRVKTKKQHGYPTQ